MSRSLSQDCGACQTRWESSECVAIGGRGTTDDPYVAEFIIDPITGNLLEQGPNGGAAFVPPRYFNLPAVHLYSTIEQVIPWDTIQGLQFNESRFNTDNMTDGGDDFGIIRINTPGVYLVTFNARWKKTRDNTFTGDLAAFLMKNGSEYVAIDSMPVPNGDSFAKHSLSTQLNLETGDFLSALLKQDVLDPAEDGETGHKNLACTVERMSPIFTAIYLRDEAIEPCV